MAKKKKKTKAKKAKSKKKAKRPAKRAKAKARKAKRRAAPKRRAKARKAAPKKTAAKKSTVAKAVVATSAVAAGAAIAGKAFSPGTPRKPAVFEEFDTSRKYMEDEYAPEEAEEEEKEADEEEEELEAEAEEEETEENFTVAKAPGLAATLKSNRFVVGLTGKNASGKGEAGHILEKLGYRYVSLSDVLRDEAALRRLEPSREVLIKLGQELREDGGPGVLAKKTIKKLQDGNYVIDSIRNPMEIELLRKLGNFLLIGVDAPIEVRFERASKRGRNENASTLEAFRQMEDREHSSRNPAQQLDRCLELVDELVTNDKDLNHLTRKIEEVLKRRSFLVF